MTRYIHILIHLSVFSAVAEVETFSSGHLVASNKYHRRYSTNDGVYITTSLANNKWPGVTNLRALLAREKDEDTSKLNILYIYTIIVNIYVTLHIHIFYKILYKKIYTMKTKFIFVFFQFYFCVPACVHVHMCRVHACVCEGRGKEQPY